MSHSRRMNRREFIVSASTATLGAAAGVGASVPAEAETQRSADKSATSAELLQFGPQRTFSGSQAIQIAMPLGGIGAGCICLNGIGGLQDFALHHHPQNSALPDQWAPSESAFALLHLKGQSAITRLVEGPFPPERIYDQGLQSQGHRHSEHEGLPRFARSVFKGEYPFGEVTLSDPEIPLEIRLLGWSPFIPLDDKNSGIPCAILEYQLENVSKERVEFEFSYHMSHLAPGCAAGERNSRNTVIEGQGIYFHNTESSNAEGCGSASLIVVGHRPLIKAMWLRGGWFDSVSAIWREVSRGEFKPNDGAHGIALEGRNGGSVLISGSLAPGETVMYPIVIAWHFPNSYLRAGQLEKKTEECTGAPDCCTPGAGAQPAWRPYYVSQWPDAREVALYVSRNYENLRSRTLAFREALFASTVPSYVLDAVSANLAILKSPTVLRQENGNLWGWEGCFPTAGCCHGSCTHVWNYAQAFPHLFPRLERTLREQELERSMDERGHVTFRSALPDGPVAHDFHAAADGQLGGIMKLYRDWQISGDTAWLQRLYPRAKRSLDYAIATWDPDHRGALFEPHHNTYDIEFWGPDGMCTGIYLGALSALAVMARAAGHPEDAPFYEDLSRKAAQFMDATLFNGEYYRQIVQYEGLRNTSFADSLKRGDEPNQEVLELLKREGPKYQYGNGCLADGVIGIWMADTYGIEAPIRRENVRRALQSIFGYNFRRDLSQHANAQRPGYAMGKEPGLLLCSWPKGDKPTLPFPYSDEVWTGIEYQVASHLIREGFLNEGLTLVKSTRSRYEGRARNPWNEYECGNYYARAMSSYAVLGALSGFRYSAVAKKLWFAPKIDTRPFQVFFAAASGFGQVRLDRGALSLKLLEGELPIRSVALSTDGRTRELKWDVVAQPGKEIILHLPG